MYRIGQGYDAHRLVEGRKLWLGGVQIPHDKGLLGHSDADVAIHALCDALLGSLALRDIGYHFPDSDPRYKGIDSKKLLVKVADLIKREGYRIVNVDVTICAERPKINPFINQMRAVLAECMDTEVGNVSIKATTTERMGFVGRQEGISSLAVAMVMKS